MQKMFCSLRSNFHKVLLLLSSGFLKIHCMIANPTSNLYGWSFWFGGIGIWKNTAAGYGICFKKGAGWRDWGTLLCTLCIMVVSRLQRDVRSHMMMNKKEWFLNDWYFYVRFYCTFWVDTVVGAGKDWKVAHKIIKQTSWKGYLQKTKE